MRWCAKGEFGGIESFVCLFVTCIIRYKQQHHLFIEQYLNQSYQKREQGFGFLECAILEVCF